MLAKISPTQKNIQAWLINQLTEQLKEELDLLPKSVNFIVRFYFYFIAKAQNQLEYEPKTVLERGIR